MRYLRNLASSNTHAGVLPWEWDTPIPDALRADKKARSDWATNPDTVWHCYNGFEGLNETLRVNRDSNPPHLMHALVVDYDAPWTEAGLQASVAKIQFAPQWLENTASEHARLLWVFERPLKLPGYEFARDFQISLAARLRAETIFPGLDHGALKAPERNMTNSGDWYDLGAKRVPQAVLQGWLVEFAMVQKCEGREWGEELPFDRLIELLRAKYPRFNTWEGDFEPGATGPSFWVDGSSSPKSAIVKPGGMFSFAEHAQKPFYSWVDLLGAEVAGNIRSEKIGAAVETVFFDGKSYWRPIAGGVWKPFDKTDVGSYMKVTLGLSPKPDKSGVSAIDRAIQFVQEHHYVEGAAPFLFRPPGVVRQSGHSYLNTSTKKPLAPVEKPTEWGPNGGFPWLSKWLELLFVDETQREHWLAWLAYFYQNCLAGTPVSGHNLIIAGGTSVGKTLLNRRVIGSLVGGFAEATDYLLGTDNFGSELFDSAHWAVDDATMSQSKASKAVFTELIKKMAANSTFRYHAKFRVPLLVEWQGRVVVTCNADPESIRILPVLNASNLDKLQLYWVANELPPGFFPDRATVEQTLDRELPYFARWIADYQIPAHLRNEDRRFGVMPHHHTGLVQVAHHSSPLAAFSEILDDWREEFFSRNTEPHWEGTSFQLFRLLNADLTAAPALRSVTVQNIGQSLVGLQARGDASLSCREARGHRLWKILRPVPDDVVAEEPKKVARKKKSKLSK